MTATDVVSHRAVAGSGSSAVDEDPISTQVVRHGLDAAADQMLVALRRTAFSPVIYDARDFAGSFYDPQFRLLAQMQSLPVFLGALGYCAEAAVAQVGGAEVLEPGDVLLSNYAYDTGSHQNDVAVIVPGFYEGELICYAVIKSHYMDVGGAWLFATHTDNIWQEGTIYPGVRIYRRGELNEDLWRTMLINTRMPKNFAGDTIAQAGACRIALEAFNRVVDRYGVERFRQAVEFMFDQSEQVTCSVIESIPDGRYVVEAAADNDGISDDLVPFEVAVEVAGSDIIVDVSNAPPQTEGPINCTPPTIVSCARCAIMALAAGGETANEGHFRPIEVRTRPGTMFHCLPSAPMAMYSWPSIHAIDHIHRALADIAPERVPAEPGSDVGAFNAWGTREDGVFWADGSIHAGGQGASLVHGDGGSPLAHISCSGTRGTSWEVWESRTPYLIEKFELATGSGGAGRLRGGPGIGTHYRALRESFGTVLWERTRSRPFGLFGGESARPNQVSVVLPDGSVTDYSKASAVRFPPGTVIRMETGGGGGIGPRVERAPEAVHGYISMEAARRDYPHAFVPEPIET